MNLKVFQSSKAIATPAILNGPSPVLRSPKHQSKDDLVSIIIPHRNQHQWLVACLDSIFSQSHANFEVLLFDDASAHSVDEIVANYDHRIRLFNWQQHVGPGALRNAGLEKAQGQFIQFLDADDFIHPDKLAVQIKLLTSSGADVALSAWRSIIQYGFLLLLEPVRQIANREKLLGHTILDDRWFPVMCGLYRNEILQRVPRWREDLSWNEDRLYRYQILSIRPNIVTSEDCHFVYRCYRRTSRSQTTNEKRVEFERELLKVINQDIESQIITLDQVHHELKILRNKTTSKLFANKSRIHRSFSFFLKPLTSHESRVMFFRTIEWWRLWRRNSKKSNKGDAKDSQ